MNVVTERHLGGYVSGGDDATWYPALWSWLIREQKIQSMLDVGCGEGHAMDFFWENGVGARGVDGVAQPDWRVYRHDYAMGAWGSASDLLRPKHEGGPYRWRGSPTFDLVWSCEFVEHVEEQFMSNFLETFKLGRLVLITHAEPGQQGYHHVNCQPREYWIGAMAAIGYRLDPVLTDNCRTLSAANRSPWNHFLRSGLAFRRDSPWRPS